MSRPTHGLRDWLLQRITAAYLAVFVIYLLVHFLRDPSPGYEEWRAWLGHPLVAAASAGFILAVLLHGWVGMRDVILDYVRRLSVRLALLTLVGMVLVGCGFWAMRVLLRVSV